MIPKRDEEKDLTANCIQLVHGIMKSLIISTDKMPYTIRAMMRIIVLQAQKQTRLSDKTRIANKTWAELKGDVMLHQQNYDKQSFFVSFISNI